MDATGRLRETFNDVKGTGQDSTQHETLVDVAVEKQVSQNWEVRVSDRSQRRALTGDVAGVDSRTTTTIHQPAVDILHLSELLEVGFNAERRATDISTIGPDNAIVRDQLFGRAEYRPQGLPIMSVQTEYLTSEDDRTLDTTDLRSIFRIGHDIEYLSAFYEHADEQMDDKFAGIDRDRTDNLFRLSGSYNDDEGLWGATLDLSHSDFEVIEKGVSQSLGELPTQIGLFDVDTTPTFGTLPARPALTDGNRTAGAGVRIGGVASGGDRDRNIGVDQGSVAREVIEIHLYTDVAFTSIEANLFAWSVYTSSDNLSWDLATGSAPFLYDIGRRRFEIQAGSVASRYVKVVNTSHATGAGAVEVAEIEILGREQAILGSTRQRQNRADSSLRLRPTEELDIVLEGGIGDLTRSDTGERIQDEDNYRVGVLSNYRPWDWITAQARASKERQDDPLLLTRDVSNYAGSLLIEANPHLGFDLSASRTEEDRDGAPFISTDAVFGRSSATLAHDILASVEVSRSWQEEAGVGRESVRDFALASIQAPLRRDLDVRLDQRVDFLEVNQAGAPTTETDTVVTGLEGTYRPTPLLTLFVDLEYWSEAIENTGLSTRTRLDWLPFPEGQLFVQLDYLRETGGVIGGPNETTFVQLRWKLDRGAFLDLTSVWNQRESTTGEKSRLRNFLVTLGFEF